MLRVTNLFELDNEPALTLRSGLGPWSSLCLIKSVWKSALLPCSNQITSWRRRTAVTLTPGNGSSVIGWELCDFHSVALERPHHPTTHTHTRTHRGTGCPGVRQQTLFNLFSSVLIGSKLPSLASWCANERGTKGCPPIAPQAHLQDTSGCRAAVCDLYTADEGGAGGYKVVSTDLDQREKDPRVNYRGGSPEAVLATPTPNEVYNTGVDMIFNNACVGSHIRPHVCTANSQVTASLWGGFCVLIFYKKLRVKSRYLFSFSSKT